MKALLDVTDLSKTFTVHILNGRVIAALREVSFRLQQNEILGITGRSGSGKSTLIKCIYRTYLPSGGEMVLRTASGAAVDLATCDEYGILDLRRSDISYCSQFLKAIPRVPAVTVVAEGLMRRGVNHREATRRSRQSLERLGLPEELWDAFPSTFSGGEQQRVNIARAMIIAPRLLLVDEPTASLDLQTKNTVSDMLLELRSAGTSIIVITHDTHTLDRIADRCLALESGSVRETVSS